MQEDLHLFKILWILTPVLVGSVGWFIIRNVNRIERDIDDNYERIQNIDHRLTRIEAEHQVRHRND
jgi:hypothetical protein